MLTTWKTQRLQQHIYSLLIHYRGKSQGSSIVLVWKGVVTHGLGADNFLPSSCRAGGQVSRRRASEVSRRCVLFWFSRIVLCLFLVLFSQVAQKPSGANATYLYGRLTLYFPTSHVRVENSFTSFNICCLPNLSHNVITWDVFIAPTG